MSLASNLLRGFVDRISLLLVDAYMSVVM